MASYFNGAVVPRICLYIKINTYMIKQRKKYPFFFFFFFFFWGGGGIFLYYFLFCQQGNTWYMYTRGPRNENNENAFRIVRINFNVDFNVSDIITSFGKWLYCHLYKNDLWRMYTRGPRNENNENAFRIVRINFNVDFNVSDIITSFGKWLYGHLYKNDLWRIYRNVVNENMLKIRSDCSYV